MATQQILSSEALKRLRQWQNEEEESGNTSGSEYLQNLIEKIERIKTRVDGSTLQQLDPDVGEQLRQWLEEEKSNPNAYARLQDLLQNLSENVTVMHSNGEDPDADPFRTDIPQADPEAFARAMAEGDGNSTLWFGDESEAFSPLMNVEGPDNQWNEDPEPEGETVAKKPSEPQEGENHIQPPIEDDPFSSQVPRADLEAFARAMANEESDQVNVSSIPWGKPPAEDSPDAQGDVSQTQLSAEGKTSSPHIPRSYMTCGHESAGEKEHVGADETFVGAQPSARQERPVTISPGLTPAQRAATMRPQGINETISPYSASAAMFGNFFSNICHGIKGLFRPAPKDVPLRENTMSALSPMPEDVFAQKTQQMLQTWKFRRAHFEQAWEDVHNNQFEIEACISRIRENPLVLRAMDDIRAAGGDEVEQIRSELAKSMGDKFSEYATSLRHDVDDLRQNMQQFQKNARIAVEASGKEPLDRFACPEALEKSFDTFFNDVLDKPELKLIADDQGESLYDKASKLVQNIKNAFTALKQRFMSLLPHHESGETEVQEKRAPQQQ